MTNKFFVLISKSVILRRGTKLVVTNKFFVDKIVSLS